MSLVLFLLGLAVTGSAVGYFVAQSNTPVVGTLLPLLFGLVAGASSIFAAKSDPNSGAVKRQLTLVGLGAVALAGASIATTEAMLSRRNVELSPTLATIPGWEKLKLPQRIDLIELRLVSYQLGASERERVSLLTSAALEPESLPAIIKERRAAASEKAPPNAWRGLANEVRPRLLPH